MSPAIRSTNRIERTAISGRRVILCSTQSAWGGGEVYLHTLAHHLRKLEFAVEFVARDGGELQKRMCDEGFAVRSVAGKGRSPLEIWRLRRWLCESQQPTILHCNDSHSLSSCGTAGLGLGHIRAVAMRHTMFPIRSVAKYHCLSDRVICVSNAVADACVQSGISREIIDVVHAAIETPSVNPSCIKNLRRELQVADNEKLIVAVGNLHSCKGHDTLIDAISKLSCSNVRLVIAGEGPRREQLEKQIQSSKLEDRVRLLGFRKDANDLMMASDLVCHPAHDEGLCLTVAAAMMLGRPVLATAVGGLKDVLGIDERMHCDNGPFSLPLAPGDSQVLAHAIEYQLSEAHNESRIAAAKQYACERFNASRMAQATADVYSRLDESFRVAA